jgi:hypothetical protein
VRADVEPIRIIANGSVALARPLPVARVPEQHLIALVEDDVVHDLGLLSNLLSLAHDVQHVLRAAHWDDRPELATLWIALDRAVEPASADARLMKSSCL